MIEWENEGARYVNVGFALVGEKYFFLRERKYGFWSLTWNSVGEKETSCVTSVSIR
jgi:hypothetical protein